MTIRNYRKEEASMTRRQLPRTLTQLVAPLALAGLLIGPHAVRATSTAGATMQAITINETSAHWSVALPAVAGGSLVAAVDAAKTERSRARTGPYKHLMTGVSYMLPVVIAGGLAIALSFALGGIYAGQQKDTLAGALAMIGGGTAFHLFVAVLSGFIAYSIADRPGIAPGLVGGMLAQNLGAGFLGGIVSGFLAGYLTKFLADKIKLPSTLEGLKPVLILPFLSTIIVGLLMIYVIAPPVQAVLDAMTHWLNGMRGANALLLGVILGSVEDGAYTRIDAEVPLSEMFGYATELRSMSQGKAEFTMEFAKYEAVPKMISEELQKKYGGAKRLGSDE